MTQTIPNPLADSVGQESKRAPTATDRFVGLQIRSLRRAAGMTLKELGNAVGVSLVQFQRYETGVSRVAIGRLVAISEVLGVRVDRLIVEPPFNATEPPAGRRRSEDIELARLFKTISDPRHRLAIIALARAIATQGKPPASMSDKFALDVRQGDDDAEVDTKQ